MTRRGWLLVGSLALLPEPGAAQVGGALYEEACDGGDMIACDVLGLMYMAGRGVFQDLARAAELFRRACDGGEANGCNHLGLLYHAGVGVEPDLAAAVDLYRRACAGGEPSACENLATLDLMPADTAVSDGFARLGRVADARTGRPLDGVIVRLPELGIEITTGTSGRVALGRLPEGTHRITAERLGYEQLEGELPVPWESDFLLLLTPLELDDLDTPGTVLGRVVAEESGEGLSEVAVTVRPSGNGTLSDRQGRFRLTEIGPGVVELELSHLGYESRTTTIVVQPGRTVEIDATLSTQAIELEPIEVTVRSGYLERNGFYRRARFVRGSRFTREQIDSIAPTMLSDLLWRVPGVSIRHDRDGATPVSRRRTGFSRGPCAMRVYVDGMPTGSWDLDQVPPEWVEAVEVYQGSSTPIRYGFGLSPCGVVLLWTRVGR